jgi:hypothetical protein
LLWGCGAKRKTTFQNGELQQIELQHNILTITHAFHKLEMWCKLFENDHSKVPFLSQNIMPMTFNAFSLDIIICHHIIKILVVEKISINLKTI